jgi:predicted nucleic acid-binding protein
VKLLLDINVILDAALRRDPWKGEAGQLLTAIETGHAEAYIAAHTLTTIHYFVSKHSGRIAGNAAVAALLRIMRVVPVGGADFLQALLLGMDDFEDAVQTIAALQIGADYVVTRNRRDFDEKRVVIRTAGEVLALL